MTLWTHTKPYMMVAFAVIVFFSMSYMFALHHEVSFSASGESAALSDEIVLIVLSIKDSSFKRSLLLIIFCKENVPHFIISFQILSIPVMTTAYSETELAHHTSSFSE